MVRPEDESQFSLLNGCTVQITLVSENASQRSVSGDSRSSIADGLKANLPADSAVAENRAVTNLPCCGAITEHGRIADLSGAKPIRPNGLISDASVSDTVAVDGGIPDLIGARTIVTKDGHTDLPTGLC